MIDSFGEGYATRSDEEGFGGIYGRNSKEDEETIGHGNAPEYDESQGCEVKEKERGRNQNKASEEAGVKGKASGQSRFRGGSFFTSMKEYKASTGGFQLAPLGEPGASQENPKVKWVSEGWNASYES